MIASGRVHKSKLAASRIPLEDTLYFFPSLLAQWLIITLLFLSVVVTIYFTAYVPFGAIPFKFGLGSSSHTFTLSIFSVISIIFLAALLHQIFDSRYIIGKDYVRGVNGLLSFQERDSRIDFENIREIEIDASLIDRILNIGDVLIMSSVNSEAVVHLNRVYNPWKLRAIIEYRKAHLTDLNRNL
jgi:uncharacterized membrane protein YdbT with pleckstrin-like domain